MRLNAMNMITKRNLNRKNLRNPSNLTSILSRHKYRVMKNRGRQLIKYLEPIKWLILNNLQNSESPETGRTKTVSRRRAFFLFFEKKGKRNSRITEAIIRGI